MAYQLQEINRSIRTDVAEFLAECDQSYAQRVSLAADRILGNLDKSPIVLLSPTIRGAEARHWPGVGMRRRWPG